METFHLPGSSAYDNDADVEEILEQYDAYIVALEWKHVPRNVARPGMLYDETNELAQRVRYKLWLRLRKKRINNLKAYIRCIVFTEVRDMVCQYQSRLSLPLDEDGELYSGYLLVTPSEGMQGPAFEVEQKKLWMITRRRSLRLY